MRILHDFAQPGRHASTLVILLPGALQQPEEFIEAGFVDAVRARRLPLDLALVDLGLQHIGETSDGTALARLHRQVLLPARRHAYREIWLAGISIGGFMALAYAGAYGGADSGNLAGLCLLAPYPGSRLVGNAIRQAGGLAHWTAPADTDDAECRVWQSLKMRGAAGLPRIHLGYGLQDRFADGQQLMAAALAPGNVETIAGGHDWPTWRRLWNNFLDRESSRFNQPIVA